MYFHIMTGGREKKEKKDFPLKPLWSREMGATESVIAPQSPPVNTPADKQALVIFH